MPSKRFQEFAALLFDPTRFEGFDAPSHRMSDHARRDYVKVLRSLRAKLRWHIDNSLSRRQQDVIRLYVRGMKEREIAAELGVTQQVAHIYKWRAINRLRKILVS